MTRPYLSAHVRPAKPTTYHQAPTRHCPGPATAPAECDGELLAGHVRCGPCKTHNQHHTNETRRQA